MNLWHRYYNLLLLLCNKFLPLQYPEPPSRASRQTHLPATKLLPEASKQAKQNPDSSQVWHCGGHYSESN
jgi:hypothetical protein